MITISYQPAGQIEATRFEKIHNVIFPHSNQASKTVAAEIAALIRERQEQGRHCVLGLATGSSPIKVYEELVRLHREDGLSFKNVISFNLDEYHPMQPDHIQSYHYFMKEHLFDHVDIPEDQINIPSGTVAVEDVAAHCRDYEARIVAAGGIDFQLLGIGRTGHIGFNEPGSHVNSATRMITLDHITRVDAAPAFLGIENVPRKAITMGIASVLSSRRVVLMAWGQHKASIIRDTIEGEISSHVPATYLQEHPNCTFILDKEAGAELTRNRTPWLVGPCDWTPEMRRKGVVWLCDLLDKSILRLTDADYNNNGMSALLAQEGSAYDLNIKMFNELQHTITGWPGGKPHSDDSHRPERAEPASKRVLIFSPHPDDDVISMGGTFDRLIEQGHQVHVAYQTSGNIAVANAEALKFAEIASAFEGNKERLDAMQKELHQKDDKQIDSPDVRQLKTLVRRSESYAATRFLGLDDELVHFLDLPFYETGTIKKKPLSTADIERMVDIIEKVKPHQIYAAGDLADPHGTHKVCLDALIEALSRLRNKPYMSECWVWLYRGAWHEWDLHEIDMAVPMSPDQVVKKRRAIYFHQSQKDGVMFQGDDSREFWLRVEERNSNTARHYRSLGLADYAAMEAFVRYRY